MAAGLNKVFGAADHSSPMAVQGNRASPKTTKPKDDIFKISEDTFRKLMWNPGTNDNKKKPVKIKEKSEKLEGCTSGQVLFGLAYIATVMGVLYLISKYLLKGSNPDDDAIDDDATDSINKESIERPKYLEVLEPRVRIEAFSQLLGGVEKASWSEEIDAIVQDSDIYARKVANALQTMFDLSSGKANAAAREWAIMQTRDNMMGMRPDEMSDYFMGLASWNSGEQAGDEEKSSFKELMRRVEFQLMHGDAVFHPLALLTHLAWCLVGEEMAVGKLLSNYIEPMLVRQTYAESARRIADMKIQLRKGVGELLQDAIVADLMWTEPLEGTARLELLSEALTCVKRSEMASKTLEGKIPLSLTHYVGDVKVRIEAELDELKKGGGGSGGGMKWTNVVKVPNLPGGLLFISPALISAFAP